MNVSNVNPAVRLCFASRCLEPLAEPTLFGAVFLHDEKLKYIEMP